MQISKEETLKRANAFMKNTLMETLDIEMVDLGADFVVARMPVTTKVHQPDGVLHGGASVALAETAGSFAAILLLKQEDVFVRGIEISANHVKSVSSGFVYATAKLIHKGRTTQLFEIKITDDAKNLISHCKLTTISLPKK